MAIVLSREDYLALKLAHTESMLAELQASNLVSHAHAKRDQVLRDFAVKYQTDPNGFEVDEQTLTVK